LRSVTNSSVAFVTSAEADLSELSVTFPFREVVDVCTEVDQVETAEQRPFAQSAAEVEAADVEAADVDWLLLLLPPHPVASVARATTATRQALPPPALAFLGIERTLPLLSPGASSARDDAGVTPTTEFHAPGMMAPPISAATLPIWRARRARPGRPHMTAQARARNLRADDPKTSRGVRARQH
jgi:hypothetical protein